MIKNPVLKEGEEINFWKKIEGPVLFYFIIALILLFIVKLFY